MDLGFPSSTSGEITLGLAESGLGKEQPLILSYGAVHFGGGPVNTWFGVEKVSDLGQCLLSLQSALHK